MKNKKLELIELRQENCGYNPEKAEDIGIITDLTNELLITTEDNHTFYFTKTDCSNEIDFIKNFPKQYGVVFNNKFYIQD